MQECEAYGNARTGFYMGYSSPRRCIARNNGLYGFFCSFTPSIFNCISYDNSSSGFLFGSNNNIGIMSNCDAYNNGGHGFDISIGGGTSRYFIEACNFVNNGGYGIDLVDGNISIVDITNCGFGAGTEANTSGEINQSATDVISVFDSVTYPADTTPWVDPANGDFRINLAEAKGAGRGTYTQTEAGQAGTIGYPDIGAAQHLDSGGASQTFHPLGGS